MKLVVGSLSDSSVLTAHRQVSLNFLLEQAKQSLFPKTVIITIIDCKEKDIIKLTSVIRLEVQKKAH